jgi:hypothetical protein
MTLQLDEPTAELLRSIAAAEKKSEAEVVRTLVTQYAARPPLPIGMGKYRSGTSDTSENASKIIRQAVKDGQWP